MAETLGLAPAPNETSNLRLRQGVLVLAAAGLTLLASGCGRSARQTDGAALPSASEAFATSGTANVGPLPGDTSSTKSGPLTLMQGDMAAESGVTMVGDEIELISAREQSLDGGYIHKNETVAAECYQPNADYPSDPDLALVEVYLGKEPTGSLVYASLTVDNAQAFTATSTAIAKLAGHSLPYCKN